MSVVRRLLELVERPADQTPDDGRVEERMAAARLAAFWLGWRLHAAPGDQDALALLDTARGALADGHAEVAGAMIRRQEYAGARALVQRAVEAGGAAQRTWGSGAGAPRRDVSARDRSAHGRRDSR